MANPQLERHLPRSPIVWALFTLGLVTSASCFYYWSIPGSRGIDKTMNPRQQGQQAMVLSVSPTSHGPEILPTIPATEAANQRRQASEAGLDPASVGWSSEALNDAAAASLKQLTAMLRGEWPDDDAQVAQLLASGFETESLRPEHLVDVQRTKSLVVRRIPTDATTAEQRQSDGRLHGVDGWRKAVQTLVPWQTASDAYAALKIFAIESAADQVTTRVYAEGYGPVESGRLQWTATWRCQWATDKGMALKLASIQVEDYEEVESLGAPGLWLSDCTEAILGNAEGYRNQLLFGMDHWVNRLEYRLRVSRLGHNGLAVGDVNGDGRDDLYVCQSGGLPNRLYVQQEDGTAIDVAARMEVDFLDDTTCALLIDLDNDGDPDLVIATVVGGLVLENEGGRFSTRQFLPECANVFSLTAADFDQDGALDLYVGRYWPTDDARGEVPIPAPYFDANNGGRNHLFRSNGNWTYDDVTVEVGLDVDNRRFTMAAAWEDLDDDGDVDLYVANDFGRNCWYRNDGGKFTNQAASAGVEDTAAGMSVSFGDYNHDRQMDIYISNMFSTAGSRTTYQRQYQETFQPDELAKLQRLARGNTLFRAKGDGRFEDVSQAAHVTMGRWAWGSLFSDLDNDGWDDLLVANGFLTTDDTGDL